MAGWTTGNSGHLIRSQLWSSQLKDILLDDLQAMGYVDWLSEFPDGTTFNIPSIGEATVRNYTEDTAVQYDAMDTGNFAFTINEYLSSATYITKKDLQDGFYMDRLVASFVPKQRRAIEEHVETNVMALSASQTASNPNTINGGDHRFVGTGTNETMALQDFARALYALKKANVPQENLIAVVDPSVEFAVNSLTNIVNVSNNPQWEGIVGTGIATGMRFLKNVYGFDVYTSNYLADANETITPSGPGGALTTAAGKANMFFSASSDVLPFVGAWRQLPEVDSEYNKDKQRDEYVTTARYGTKLYRPENLVCVLTDTDQV